MSGEKDNFWLVWNPQRGSPSFRHTNGDSALAEAKRLAIQHPGEGFFTLVAVHAVQAMEPVTVTKLDDIPF